MNNTRGFFGIGVYHIKNGLNIGTLWRGAYQLGAAFVFTVGRRYKKQSSDTCKTWKHLPLYHYADFDEFMANRPHDCLVTAIEFGGVLVNEYNHPERTVYLLGAEDHGLPDDIIARCNHHISIPSIRTESYNVAQAGTIVMYDRVFR